MSKRSTEKLIPALFCVLAAVAFAAAALLLFDLREHFEDDHLPHQATAAFVSYSASDDDAQARERQPAEEPVVEEIELSQLLSEEGWEILEPVDLDAESEKPEQPSDLAEATADAERSVGSDTRRPARGQGTIVVVTNFNRAQVTINGEAYPSYFDDGQNHGMRLAAGELHEVRVRFDGNEKVYRVSLQPGERRLLMVELTGFRAGPPPPPRTEREPRPPRARDLEEIPETEGRITVYANPRGTIFVGERDMGEQTPGMVTVDPGRHEVQVRYEDGEMSETKVVRVREGSHIKLFFKQD